MSFFKKFHFSLFLRAVVIKFFLMIFTFPLFLICLLYSLLWLFVQGLFVFFKFLLYKLLNFFRFLFKIMIYLFLYLLFKLDCLKLYFYEFFVSFFHHFIIIFYNFIVFVLNFLKFYDIHLFNVVMSVVIFNINYWIKSFNSYLMYLKFCDKFIYIKFVNRVANLGNLNLNKFKLYDFLLLFYFVYPFFWFFSFLFVFYIFCLNFIVLASYSWHMYIYVLDLEMLDSNISYRIYLFFASFWSWNISFFLNYLSFYKEGLFMSSLFFFYHIVASMMDFLKCCYFFFLNEFYLLYIKPFLPFILSVMNLIILNLDEHWFTMDPTSRAFLLKYLLNPLYNFFVKLSPVLVDSFWRWRKNSGSFVADLFYMFFKFWFKIMFLFFPNLIISYLKRSYTFFKHLFYKLMQMFFDFYNHVLMPSWYFLRMPTRKWRIFFNYTFLPTLLNFLFKKFMMMSCILFNVFLMFLHLLKFFYSWLLYLLNYFLLLIYLKTFRYWLFLLDIFCFVKNLYKSKRLFFIVVKLVYLDILELFYNVKRPGNTLLKMLKSWLWS